MSATVDQELKDAADNLHRSVSQLTVTVPDNLEELVGPGSRPHRSITPARKRQAIWLVAAAVLGVLAVAGILIALQDDDTVSAGDPNLTPDQIAQGFAQSVASADAEMTLAWFTSDALVFGSFLEPTTQSDGPVRVAEVAPNESEMGAFEAAMEVEDYSFRFVACETSTNQASCQVEVTSSLSTLTAIDGSWTMYWDVETDDGRISALTVAPHDEMSEVAGIKAYRHWFDANAPVLTEAEWIDLTENRPEELAQMEAEGREDYAVYVESEIEAAVRLGQRVCADIADGANPQQRLESAWRFADLVVPPIPPLAVAATVRAECGEAIGNLLSE